MSETEKTKINTHDVKLLEHTMHMEWLLYIAYRRCQSAKSYNELAGEVRGADVEALIKRCIKSGHLTPLEHVQFTFHISGISRACSHQLVRYRHATFSQQSQRYISAASSGLAVPELIQKNDTANEIFMKTQEQIYATFNKLREFVPIEDARYIMSNATTTSLIMTMNARELLHFFEQRCCYRAQWEIRAVAYKMLSLCKEHLPCVFDEAGPPCIKDKVCHEEKSCGRYPKQKAQDSGLYKEILERLEYARMKHPVFAWNKHEALQVVLAEMTELVNAVMNGEGQDREASEALDVVATALRFYLREYKNNTENAVQKQLETVTEAVKCTRINYGNNTATTSH